jgi:small-conductance mechanosensitive channel
MRGMPPLVWPAIASGCRRSLSVTFTVAGVLGSLAAAAGERRALGGAMTGLALAAVRVAALGIGFLVFLDALGVQITPLLTALGVGGLAVALALQDSLSNLFAGVHLLADKPIRVGDYVRIADSVEGYDRAEQEGGRGERRLSLLLRVGVGYGSDPDRGASASRPWRRCWSAARRPTRRGWRPT